MAFGLEQQLGGGTSLADLFRTIQPLPPQPFNDQTKVGLGLQKGIGNTPPIVGGVNLLDLLQNLISKGGSGQQTGTPSDQIQPFRGLPPTGQTPLNSLTGVDSFQTPKLKNPFGGILNQGFVR